MVHKAISVFCLLLANLYLVQSDDPELDLTTPWDIIKHYGYPVEKHNVTTSDGFILSAQRIPHGRKSKKSTKPPVLFISPLFTDSAIWIIQENDLAYKLADLGHDVWIYSNRGSTNSEGHTHLNPDQSEYWNFSYHEMGVYDVAGVIDYILEKTKQKLLYCIGFSQGGAALAVMLSKLPEYNQKVRLAIFFSPAIYLSSIWRPLQMMSRNGIYTHSEEFIEKHGYFGLFHHGDPFLRMLLNDICMYENMKLCVALLMYMVGPNYNNVNWKLLPALGSHYPAAISVKQLTHFGQVIKTGDFAEYAPYRDLSSPTYKPKLYNISAITAPAAIFHGNNDWTVTPADVRRFARQLPNLVVRHVMADRFFNHLDFNIGKNKGEMVDPYVIELLDKF